MKRLASKSELFVPYEEKAPIVSKRECPKKRLSAGVISHYVGKFFSASKASSISLVLLSAFLLFSNALIMSMQKFTPSDFYRNYDDTDGVVLVHHEGKESGAINYNLMAPLGKEVDVLKEAGIEMEEILSYRPWTGKKMTIDTYYIFGWDRWTSTYGTISSVFPEYTRTSTNGDLALFSGTRITTEERLRERFGIEKDEDLFVYKTDYEPHGLFITDFEAKEILNANKSIKSLENLLGYQKVNKEGYAWDSRPIYINGIIKTDYETVMAPRRADLLAQYPITTKTADLGRSEELYMFSVRQLYDYNAFYSLNPNFIEDKAEEGDIVVDTSSFQIFDGENIAFGMIPSYGNAYPNVLKTLEDNEIVLARDFRNNWCAEGIVDKKTNTDLVQRIENGEKLELILKITSPYGEIHEMPVKVSGGNMPYTRVGKGIGAAFFRLTTKPVAVRVKDFSQVASFYDGLSKNHYYHTWFPPVASSTIVFDALTMFSSFFEIVFNVLTVTVCLYVVISTLYSVNKFRNEIGILKSLGARNADIAAIFAGKNVLSGIGSLTSMVLLSLILLRPLNGVVISTINTVLLMRSSIQIDSGVPLLSFRLEALGYGALVILALSLITTIVTFLLIKRVKTVDIIRSKY